MSRTMFAFVTAGAVLIAGCGSSAHFADKSRPPTPIDLTIYVNDSRVSVSPARVGAGPVIFYVTNAASRTESVSIQGPGGSHATTGPINPQSTARVTVDFTSPGDYTISTSAAAASDAALTGRGIQPATLRIGAPRPNADNVLLQP